ncbi:MAG: hypothetical protein KKB70_05390 [Proteobacteria bacterium]|nr:hypothetical protein [Pseudomonadota bacterium]MBU1610212.1 hypothetical protein [Pseudomonadota bacterium]
MTTKSLLPVALFLFLAFSACSPDKESLVGKYTAQGDATEVVLTLGEDGRGTWSTDLDEISFKWSLSQDGQVWLHTTDGGVLSGTHGEEGLVLTLPGVGEFVFSRQ